MKQIANIVSEKELTNHKRLEWVNYHSKPEDADLMLPTLVVGWNLFKNKFKHLHPDILNKAINPTYPKVCWEFSMEEKITDHFTGVENFIKQAPRIYSDSFSYTSIDPIKNNIRDTNHLFEVVDIAVGSYYQYKEEIIYVYNPKKRKIVGVYLNAFKYFGFNIKEITSQFAEKFKMKTIDSDGSIYQSYYRQFPDFDQLKRSIVLFLF